jgi:hypothetical protein
MNCYSGGCVQYKTSGEMTVLTTTLHLDEVAHDLGKRTELRNYASEHPDLESSRKVSLQSRGVY